MPYPILRVSTLAEAKQLPSAFLLKLGLTDLPDGVGISYVDETG